MGEAAEKRRILVIEDDESIALGLQVNLEAEGYSAVLATDGERGLELARDGFDLIVLDLMIPGVNGFEVLRTLRGEGRKTPVLVLSARNYLSGLGFWGSRIYTTTDED